MSYDLAVWERGIGPGPAIETYEALVDRYLEGEGPHPPASEAIERFIREVVAEYPDDLPDERVDEGVWASEPLLGEASGPFSYLSILSSHAADVVPHVVHVAATHGLVCFDPQSGEVLSA